MLDVKGRHEPADIAMGLVALRVEGVRVGTGNFVMPRGTIPPLEISAKVGFGDVPHGAMAAQLWTDRNFSLCFSAHAIEQCSSTIAFSEILPEKSFQRVLSNNRERIDGIFSRVETPQLSIQFDFATGRMIQNPSTAPVHFVSPDMSTTLIVRQMLSFFRRIDMSGGLRFWGRWNWFCSRLISSRLVSFSYQAGVRRQV